MFLVRILAILAFAGVIAFMATSQVAPTQEKIKNYHERMNSQLENL